MKRHPPAAASRGRLLIVEDDADVRDTLTEVLGLEGWEVGQAADGREALARLAGDAPYDAILLDLMMPVMSGWEFRRVQLGDPALASIPVVVLSASSPAGLEPDGHLTKPFSVDALLAVLDRVLGGARLAPG